MVKYLIQRILISIPTLIAISIVIFTILALAPGDPMGEFALNSGITAEVRENIRRSLGLEQPALSTRTYALLGRRPKAASSINY